MFVLFRPGQDVWAYGVEPAKVKYRLRLARYPALAEYLLSWLCGQDPQRTYQLLDIGSGFGRTFVYLDAAGIGERFEFLGMDIDPGRKDDVFAENPYTIVAGDAESPLRFERDSFDVVVCEQLLEHLHNPHQLISEIHRILRPGGLFVCGVPTFPEPIAKLRRAMVRRYGLRGSDHVQTYSLRAIRKDLQPYFEVDEVRGFRIISG